MLFVLALFGCRRASSPAVANTVASDDRVTIVDVRFPSPALHRRLWYRAIVPRTNPHESLPVLYFLHGANSDPTEVMERARMEKLAADARLLLVMPYGEYSYFTNAKYKWHARWEDAMTRDLRTDVEARFPVQTGRQHTGIAGISMGGYGAIKIALKYPELYSFAGVLSGALDITRRPATVRRLGQTWRIWTIFGVTASQRRGEDVLDLVKRSADVGRTTWFESCGQYDPLHPINEQFVRAMRARGIPLEAMTTPHGHDWQAWNAVISGMFAAAGRALR